MSTVRAVGAAGPPRPVSGRLPTLLAVWERLQTEFSVPHAQAHTLACVISAAY